MAKYKVKKFKHKRFTSCEEYDKAYQDAEETIIEGLGNVFSYCGGKLKKDRFGYSRCVGGYDYIARRVDQ